MIEQPGWLHAVRARFSARANDTPTCLDSTSKGKVIDFFVVSEELRPFVRTVMVDERPTVPRTHWPFVLTLEGVKRGPKAAQACQAPRVPPVGPSEDPRVTLRMRAAGTLGRCGARNAGQSCPAMGTHGGNGSPLQVRRCRRGKVHRQGDSAYHATATTSGQVWTRAGRGRRCNASDRCAACYRGHPRPSVAQSSATYVENFAACVGVLRTTRQQCGAGERAGEACLDGRTQGCM